ncbi:MAG: hypothetical protein AAF090_18440 [Bacteroidota bacterium]
MKRTFLKKAQLTLQTALAEELVFSEVELGQNPSVGDEAMLDGKPAHGTFMMPEGHTLIISEGVIVEIIPASEDVAAQLKNFIKRRNSRRRVTFKK